MLGRWVFLEIGLFQGLTLWVSNIDTLVAKKGQPPNISDFELSLPQPQIPFAKFRGVKKKEIPFFSGLRGKFVDIHLRCFLRNCIRCSGTFPFSNSAFPNLTNCHLPKILGHHTTYWWILAHVWRSICWTYVPKPQLTGGWTTSLWDISHDLKKCRFDGRLECTLRKKRLHHLTSLRFQSTSMSGWFQSHQPCQCTNEYRFLRINVLSLRSLLYNLGLDHIFLESPIYIYIYYHVDKCIYIYTHSIYLYPISYPPKMSFELLHVASAILARSSMASTFTSATTHDPRRDPATHRSLPSPSDWETALGASRIWWWYYSSAPKNIELKKDLTCRV